MTSEYIHPNLYTDNDLYAGTILDLHTGELVKPGPHIVDRQVEVTFNMDAFLSRLRKMEEFRVALKIPSMSYCAHSFPSRGFDQSGVLNLIEYARSRWETRFWVNHQSALLLICIADPVLGENAGWDFFLTGENIPGRASYHMPAWWEFCLYGTLVPEDWKLEASPYGHIKMTSPDGRYGAIIG